MNIIKTLKSYIGDNGAYTYSMPVSTVKGIIKEVKQLQQEIKELEFIVGLRQKRNLIHKFDKEYDEEDKKKNPNRKYAAIMPDAEEVYKRYYKQKEVIDKATNDIQEIIDAVNKNTIISMKQFNIKLEVIQDELGGSNDILKEVSE